MFPFGEAYSDQSYHRLEPTALQLTCSYQSYIQVLQVGHIGPEQTDAFGIPDFRDIEKK